MHHSRLSLAAALLLAAGPAAAHPGHEAASFLSGFAHPLGGADHLLAMLAVGLFAARQEGAARWALPAGFLAALLAGVALGRAGLALPMIEAGIAASVLVLGLLVASLARLPLGAGLGLVAAFGVWHGHAHGAEMGAAGLLSYAFGLALASALLHGAGLVLGLWRPEAAWAVRLQRGMGAAIAAAGALLLAG